MTTATIASLIEQPVRVFDLEQPRFQGMPVIAVHQPGYAYFLHRRHSDDYRPERTGLRSGASGVIVCMEHSGTHIDAICHQADNQMLYGGIPAAEVSGTKGFTKLAIEEVPPMLTPGVLLDAAAEKGVTRARRRSPRHRRRSGSLLPAPEGRGSARRRGADPHRQCHSTGTIRSASWPDPAWTAAPPSGWPAKGVLAVGADNMAWDVIGLRDPTFNCQLPGHLILLARHGIHIIENMQLEQLAAAGCLPLHLHLHALEIRRRHRLAGAADRGRQRFIGQSRRDRGEVAPFGPGRPQGDGMVRTAGQLRCWDQLFLFRDELSALDALVARIVPGDAERSWRT